MKTRKTKEEKWNELEEQVKSKLEEARKRALLADSFTEMETIADQVGREVEQELLGALAEQQEPGSHPTCSECGAKCRGEGRSNAS